MAVTPSIPGYEIKKLLGEGARASVYEALEPRSGRIVALKILRDDLVSDQDARARFHREARALMCVAHPNVAAVYDYSGETAERLFIAMEIYDGKSLRALLEEKHHFQDAQAAAIFAQVFTALDAAHSEGLLHRDLSLSSIVVGTDGRVIVGDFGLVASLAGTRTGEVLTEASDLYAAGLCFAQILLGRAPTAGERVSESGATVDVSLAKIADALTDQNPRKRPLRAADVERSLFTWLKARGIDAAAEIAAWLSPTLDRDTVDQTGSVTDELAGIRITSRGRFEAESLLGQGGMARVFRGRDNRLGRAVAIKLMHVDDAVTRKRFHREARALARIKHPNVMEVVDYSGPSAPLPYIVLELVDGSTLERIVRVKPMSERVALCVAMAVTEGLEAVHREGFIHRDLKPENIFADGNGRVIIADFGIVRSARSDTTGTFVSKNTAAVGSPLYASPEQIFDPDSAGPASDLFSLGSVLYFLLTGQAPVSDKNVTDALDDLNRGNLQRLPDSVSADLRQLVRQLHQLEPRNRPGSAGEVAAQLRAMLAARKVVDPRAELRTFLGVETTSETKIATTIATRLRRTAPSTTAEQPKRKTPVLLLALTLVGVLFAAAWLLKPAAPPPAPTTALPVESPPLELPAPEPSALPVPTPVEIDPLPKEAVKTAGPATLRFFIKPWAKISIGDRVYGTTPLFNTLELPPGRYVVRFENPAYKTVEKKIDLKGGERREVYVTLERP